MKQIAVVGGGIAGLTAAYLLSRRHVVHLFEKDSRLGGHTHTVVVDRPGGPLALDTGFLVHNERTYPLLVRLFAELGVATDHSDMSFSVACERTGLQYSSRGAHGFFAQKRNLVSPSHLRLLAEIRRFNREARAALPHLSAAVTLADFLGTHGFGRAFADRYLIPMASAIWSSSPHAIRQFPFLTLATFLENHGLLAIDGQPPWKVVRGGSSTYIPHLIAPLDDRIHRSVHITGITRHDNHVSVDIAGRPSARFDDIVVACHGDQVLRLLSDPTPSERDVFSRFRTTTNDAWLHTDASWLPTRTAARASWNYRLADDDGEPPTVTYHLNRLQSLSSPEEFCVTLNPSRPIDSRHVIARMSYAHPLYDRGAIDAQQRWANVSGPRRTHYCGAYWFYGFHEDGVRSAVRVAKALGVTW